MCKELKGVVMTERGAGSGMSIWAQSIALGAVIIQLSMWCCPALGAHIIGYLGMDKLGADVALNCLCCGQEERGELGCAANGSAGASAQGMGRCSARCGAEPGMHTWHWQVEMAAVMNGVKV